MISHIRGGHPSIDAPAGLFGPVRVELINQSINQSVRVTESDTKPFIHRIQYDEICFFKEYDLMFCRPLAMTNTSRGERRFFHSFSAM